MQNPHCTEYFCNKTNFTNCTKCYKYLKDILLLDDIKSLNIQLNVTESKEYCDNNCKD